MQAKGQNLYAIYQFRSGRQNISIMKQRAKKYALADYQAQQNCSDDPLSLGDNDHICRTVV